MRERYYKEYFGGFISLNKTEWDVDIFRKSSVPLTPKEIAFSESPLEIEWAETDKLEPVCGSSAKLNLFSDTDRQFINLYTIEPGAIYIEISRNNVLYWSGTLDPELYEEPYSFKENYSVSLTFSDFAALDRFDWNMKGLLTMRQIIEHCLNRSGIQYGKLIEYISTNVYVQHLNSLLNDVTILGTNFFDEDGEPMTFREVLEETLRPFGLRMIQKGGNIIIYDLNAVSTFLKERPIRWEGDNAVLGVDKIYNNVIINFSPYEKTTVCHDEIIEKSLKNPKTFSYNTGYNTYAEKGFDIHLYDEGEGIEKGEKTKFFKIEPINSGSEDIGVAWEIQTYYKPKKEYTSQINEPTYEMGEDIMYTSRAYLANTEPNTRSKYKLKLTLDLLFDVRYNPFESESANNEEGNWKNLKNWCNTAYVPIVLNLYTSNGNILHYDNKEIYGSSKLFTTTSYRWTVGKGKWGDAFLAYYDFSDRKTNTGLGGWKENKHIIGYQYGNSLSESFQKKAQGEIIELPYSTGWLELTIGAGVLTYEDPKSDCRIPVDIYKQTRWVLYKTPKITLIDSNYKDVKTKDIEYKAWLNKSAKEELSIDTVLGTLSESSPTALGQLFRTADKGVINNFWRANLYDKLERLLIGSIYSNYNKRTPTLSGTVSLLPDFAIYSDSNEKGKFLILSEVQRLKEEESEIKMAVVERDIYHGIEFTD